MDQLLNTEIKFLTFMIQENYPELYIKLTETLLYSGEELEEKIDIKVYENYLETLTTQYIDVRLARDKERLLT